MRNFNLVSRFYQTCLWPFPIFEKKGINTILAQILAQTLLFIVKYLNARAHYPSLNMLLICRFKARGS
jgi:hypothetical protein